MEIKGRKIKLDFSWKFYNEYKREIEFNLGKKVSKEEVVECIVRDLLGMYERLEDFYK